MLDHKSPAEFQNVILHAISLCVSRIGSLNLVEEALSLIPESACSIGRLIEFRGILVLKNFKLLATLLACMSSIPAPKNWEFSAISQDFGVERDI